jgi:hypothetical protein
MNSVDIERGVMRVSHKLCPGEVVVLQHGLWWGLVVGMGLLSSGVRGVEWWVRPRMIDYDYIQMWNLAARGICAGSKRKGKGFICEG